ncbi:BQ5605_C003g02386 [Microbotryum silenes-dioicae]|uniref:BQ5605_C003g02386 protein n=1 Tax=Microbotryum silenes-dioicae TaxID=796604 RepID=A0A2X0NYQ6_9BASI|nr:BQ5605_C003g02386 [Microbotryum silenes-dioicae]
MQDMSQVTIRIPDQGKGDLVGILQRANPAESTKEQKLALILHGVMAHKDQVYHKLLADRLASERGLDSFRYDLRAQGGESEGRWGMANFGDDADDLAVVIAYLEKEYAYRIHLIAAHSRGSMLSAYYLSKRPHPPIPLWINISGRYDMSRIMVDKRYGEEFWEKGEHLWKVRVRGKDIAQRVTREDVIAFASWDNSYLQASFPQDVHVLTVHGTADPVVPVQDAYSYHKILSQRSPGTHTLSIVEGETHNYTKPFREPVNSIMSWLEKVDGKGTPSTSDGPGKARL